MPGGRGSVVDSVRASCRLRRWARAATAGPSGLAVSGTASAVVLAVWRGNSLDTLEFVEANDDWSGNSYSLVKPSSPRRRTTSPATATRAPRERPAHVRLRPLTTPVAEAATTASTDREAPARHLTNSSRRSTPWTTRPRARLVLVPTLLRGVASLVAGVRRLEGSSRIRGCREVWWPGTLSLAGGVG